MGLCVMCFNKEEREDDIQISKSTNDASKMSSRQRKLSEEVDRNEFQGQGYGLIHRQEKVHSFFYRDQEAGGSKVTYFIELVGEGQGKKLREVYFL